MRQATLSTKSLAVRRAFHGLQLIIAIAVLSLQINAAVQATPTIRVNAFAIAGNGDIDHPTLANQTANPVSTCATGVSAMFTIYAENDPKLGIRTLTSTIVQGRSTAYTVNVTNPLYHTLKLRGILGVTWDRQITYVPGTYPSIERILGTDGHSGSGGNAMVLPINDMTQVTVTLTDYVGTVTTFTATYMPTGITADIQVTPTHLNQPARVEITWHTDNTIDGTAIHITPPIQYVEGLISRAQAHDMETRPTMPLNPSDVLPDPDHPNDPNDPWVELVSDPTTTPVCCGHGFATPNSTTTYTLTATNPFVSITKTATVTITPPPTINFRVDPNDHDPHLGYVNAGKPLTLSWTVVCPTESGACHVSLQGFDQTNNNRLILNAPKVPSVGNFTIQPEPQFTKYRLTASNDGGTQQKDVDVQLYYPTPPPQQYSVCYRFTNPSSFALPCFTVTFFTSSPNDNAADQAKNYKTMGGYNDYKYEKISCDNIGSACPSN